MLLHEGLTRREFCFKSAIIDSQLCFLQLPHLEQAPRVVKVDKMSNKNYI